MPNVRSFLAGAIDNGHLKFALTGFKFTMVSVCQTASKLHAAYFTHHIFSSQLN